MIFLIFSKMIIECQFCHHKMKPNVFEDDFVKKDLHINILEKNLCNGNFYWFLLFSSLEVIFFWKTSFQNSLFQKICLQTRKQLQSKDKMRHRCCDIIWVGANLAAVTSNGLDLRPIYLCIQVSFLTNDVQLPYKTLQNDGFPVTI